MFANFTEANNYQRHEGSNRAWFSRSEIQVRKWWVSDSLSDINTTFWKPKSISTCKYVKLLVNAHERIKRKVIPSQIVVAMEQPAAVSPAIEEEAAPKDEKNEQHEEEKQKKIQRKTKIKRKRKRNRKRRRRRKERQRERRKTKKRRTGGRQKKEKQVNEAAEEVPKSQQRRRRRRREHRFDRRCGSSACDQEGQRAKRRGRWSKIRPKWWNSASAKRCRRSWRRKAYRDHLVTNLEGIKIW